MSEYDSLAKIYELWSSADKAFLPSQQFYIEVCKKGVGPIVELGVGTGRIAIEIAQLGIEVIGIDKSTEMLKICEQRAGDLDLKNIHLIQEDVRTFTLSQTVNTVIFPFRSIGHLLSMDEKSQLFKHVYKLLKPGGLFIFDHYVFDEKWAISHEGIPRLMYADLNKNSGLFIWDIYKYDFQRQLMDCFILIEETDEFGNIKARKYNPLSFSWILPNQVKVLSDNAGFTVDQIYGDFSLGPFNKKSENQVWILRRP